ncbi:Asp/Glu racemase [Pseudomonas sp. B6002]|uniref:aspartate/glutamate racemase family protein n=1 Tax=Pseudomonas sp. B6002 TaxID=2726978 RepID=UPI00159FDADC|nr:aspartate/glutamate racemase family protein [Pseudomonas sp. B6002]NVZ50626.1 Asp/Glu racemase [Pseudomonas sp. B6002]
MRIACLHTATSNIAVFAAAAEALGVAPDSLRHEVRADLLTAAELAGGLTEGISRSTVAALVVLSENADVVLLTCSTLGPAVDDVPTSVRVPILRTDEALATAAVQTAGKVVVLCAVSTTLEPTSNVFHTAALQTNAAIDVRLVPGAWALFKAGDNEGYLSAIAKAADRAYVDGASVVALGQASMGEAASRVVAGPPPLTSAMTGLKAALKAIEG